MVHSPFIAHGARPALLHDSIEFILTQCFLSRCLHFRVGPFRCHFHLYLRL